MFRQIIFPILLVLLFPVWLQLLIKLRLGVALAYVVLGNTLLFDWTTQHTVLADGILFVILAGTVLSWSMTLYRKRKGYRQ